MVAGNQLGADWGDDDVPETLAESTPGELETKKQKVEAKSSASDGPNKANELPEIKIPDRVKTALQEAKDFEDFRKKRVFKYLHAYSGPEDVLGKAIKWEAEKARLRCPVVSLDKLL